MSNETDRLVSDAYNELANERTPEALNQEVLRLAAKAGRTRYSIARAWMRPVAWAATIGLSLVVVLELANTPGSDMAPLPQSAPLDPAVTPPQASAPFRDTMEKEVTLEPEDSEQRQDALAKRSRPYSPEAQQAEKAMMSDDTPVVSEDTARNEIAAQSTGLQNALEADDLDDLQDSMERARQQASQRTLTVTDAGQAEEPVAEESIDVAAAPRAKFASEQPATAARRAEAFTAGSSSLRAESEHLCPAEVRLSAEKWLECIQELEASLPLELVDREYESLRKGYPEFEHPAMDR